MSKEEVITYFKKGSEDVIQDEILELAEKVGYLPLYIVSAKSYMDVTHISARKYLELLCSKVLLRIDEERIPVDFDKHSMKAIDIVLSKLQMGLSEEAYNVLTYVPFLEHDNIPVSVLESILPKYLSSMSRQIEVNQIISEIQKYSFGEVRGTNDSRIISFHAASSLAVELRLEQGEEADKVRTLLNIFMNQLKVGIRRWTTLQENVLLLRHATKLLQKAKSLLDSRDMEVMVLTCYINCAVGASYRLQGVEDFLAHNFQREARRLCFQIACMEDTTSNNVDVDITKRAKRLYTGLVKASTEKMRPDFVQNFIESRLRNKEDIEYLCKEGGFDRKDFPNYQMQTYIYERLIKTQLAMPLDKIQKHFLVELALYIIYNNGRDLYRISKKYTSLNGESKHGRSTGHTAISKYSRSDSDTEQVNRENGYQEEFRFAHELNRLLQEGCGDFLMFQGTIIERHGMLYVDLRALTLDSSKREEEEENVLRLIEKTKTILNDGRYYYEFGVVMMAKDYKKHHEGTCLKHLLKQYKILHSLADDQDEKQRYYEEGLQYANQLQLLTNKLTDCNALPGIHIQLAKYYMVDPNRDNLKRAEIQLHDARIVEQRNKGNVLSHCMLQYWIHSIRCLILHNEHESLKRASAMCDEFTDQLERTDRDKYIRRTNELRVEIEQKL